MPQIIANPDNQQEYTFIHQYANASIDELNRQPQDPTEAERRRISLAVRDWARFFYGSLYTPDLGSDDEYRIGNIGRRLAEQGYTPESLPLLDPNEEATTLSRAETGKDELQVQLAMLGIPEVITTEKAPDQPTWKDVLTTHWANFFGEAFDQIVLSPEDVGRIENIGQQLIEIKISPSSLPLINAAERKKMQKLAEERGDLLQQELARLGIPEVIADKKAPKQLAEKQDAA